ncbi:jg14404 [Pararge aegeria aegeria]|uniref:RNA helicase n=1 Tax=Pararge aegeria aegeria TaxID=348720 RepID=A0A8S4S0J0_9NEOP|nr:jg14404 [Pararge aegeria aegeria]
MTSPRTKVKYLTDGMLLREAMTDPLLKKYSVIILDEAHERTVNTDVLFGIVKLAQKERDEQKNNSLKVIVMSATMDVDAFRKYYNNCPVIYLEGRTYPVTIYHSKIKHEDYQYAAVCTIFQLHATTPANHDFLVFLTGQEEIETVMSNIKQIAKEAKGPPIKVCPLYAGLPASKQLQVWKKTPSGMRKIVLATNIAEASVTIPQIKCVIDTGAIDNENNPELTVLGKKMTAFPIDPKYSKVLLCAPEFNCLEEALSLVAVMSSENVFHTPLHKREEALKVKQKFISPLGDHITLLNVFKAFCKAPLKKQWCRENYLNHKNLTYAYEIRLQLLGVCQRLNMSISSCGTALDQLLKCLLSGLFTNCAWARTGAGGGGRYVTSAGVAAMLHPSGVLHSIRPAPPAVLYSELLHTKRSYVVTVSAIQPQWLHQVAPEYARRCRASR